MSEDARSLVLDAITYCMSSIFKDIPQDDFLAEADALMCKWAQDKGGFGVDGMVDAMLWWQDQVTKTNAFPLTRN